MDTTQPPTKRMRGAFGNAANRLSMMGIANAAEDGRQSRLGRLSAAASRRFSMPAGRFLAPFHEGTRGGAHLKVKLAVVGNTGCGKTEVIQYVCGAGTCDTIDADVCAGASLRTRSAT